MRSFLDRIASFFRPASDWLVAQCARLPRHTLAWASIGLALVLLLSVNLFAGSALRNAKADLTQQRLFTISGGTRTMLRAIDEPISLRLYFSKRLGEAAPVYARYFERVRALLQQYGDISGGRARASPSSIRSPSRTPRTGRWRRACAASASTRTARSATSASSATTRPTPMPPSPSSPPIARPSSNTTSPS